jgi:hypothetical protein
MPDFGQTKRSRCSNGRTTLKEDWGGGGCKLEMTPGMAVLGNASLLACVSAGGRSLQAQPQGHGIAENHEF